MENMKKFNFECLVFDTDNSSTITSRENLLHSILSNGSIWAKETPDFDLSNIKINGGDNFCLTIHDVDTDPDISGGNSKAFLLKIEGTFEKLEPRRIQILQHMKEQYFKYLYVLVDEISKNIAEKLYPLIYQVENNLRAFLTRFMTIKIGPEWFKKVDSKKVQDTVKNRKNNEINFRDFIKNDIYLIDFSDLGRCIYSYSSGGIQTKEDIVNKILKMEETVEAILQLKEQVKSNQEKFFEDSFKNKKFQSQWEQLRNIRNKVAHNNLFVNDDLETGEKLAENLLSIIKEANENIQNISFSAEERKRIKDNFPLPWSYYDPYLYSNS